MSTQKQKKNRSLQRIFQKLTIGVLLYTKIDFMGKKETKAIELKYMGETYEKISQMVGVSLPTIKEWFSSSGRLRGSYLEYEREQNDFLNKEAKLSLKRSVPKASKTLRDLLDDKNPTIRLRAAHMILERELGISKEVDNKGKLSIMDLVDKED